VRAISQAGLYPSNCRILDPTEAYNTGAADGSVAIMVLAFESADHDVAPWDETRARMLRGSRRHARRERR
jgi:alkyldihydroxyacetonephosphate synthase